MRAFVVAAALAFALPAGVASAAEHQVSMESFKYLPASLEVAVGDTVVFTNKDPVPHTVTDRGGAFDSGKIETAGTWTWTATEAGEFSYYCTLHPRMAGAIVVK